MNKLISTFTILALVFVSIFHQSCSKDLCSEKKTYIKLVPFYQTTEELRDVQIEAPREMRNPGKIYVYNNYLFVNEPYEGIHIIDNRDIANPIPISFLSIKANLDMAIRNGYLYADNLIDLVIFDIRDPSHPVYEGMQQSVFNVQLKRRTTDLYLVKYIETEETVEIDCSNSEFGQSEIWQDDGSVLWNLQTSTNERSVTSDFNKSGSTNKRTNNPNGQGGSFAKFSLVNDRLYIIDRLNLNIYDVSNASVPQFINKVKVSTGIETIFPYKENLFIGSSSGLYIYNNQNRDLPVFVSKFEHARACDPVFVQGDVAYVTLRNGTRCRGFINQLDVIDISNLSKPKMIKSYKMKNPHGLSIIDDRLILCEGKFGLKVLDIKDNTKIKTLSAITNKHYYDVIGISSEHIIITGNDGVFQYEMKDNVLNEMSSIFSK